MCMKQICKKHKFYNNIFNYKIMLMLICIFLISVLVIAALYKLLLIRYIMLFIVISIIYVFRKKVISMIQIKDK